MALEAVGTFHTEVSEEVLFREKALKGLGDRLLRRAQEFCGRLGGLLEQSPDRRSQAMLAAVQGEVGALTGHIGTPHDALLAYQRALATCRQLADGPAAGAADRGRWPAACWRWARCTST